MAPSHVRHLLAWTLPTITILLSYLWYKRKRIGAQSDPGSSSIDIKISADEPKIIEEEIEEALSEENSSFSRSLSGVDSAPIDIIVPRELRAHKPSNPIVISDEDLDFEIEKIKSMKNTTLDPFRRSQSTDAVDGDKIKTPVEEKTPEPKVSTPANSVGETIPSPVKASPIYKSPRIIKSSPPLKVVSPNLSMAKNANSVSSTEDKFNSLKLDTQDSSKISEQPKMTPTTMTTEHEELQRQSSERDSANHSPADVMLASPSLSSISDNHSEGSNDSGKGGSDVATPPSRTPAGNGSISDDTVPLFQIHEFEIPQSLVGRLIGRHGSTIAEIKQKSKAHIIIRKHPTSTKMKLCVIEGLQTEINAALKIIREKFPAKRYSDLTLEQVDMMRCPTVALTPDQLHLKLIEGINNDTIVSCMVAPDHLFLHQPTHPTFPSLNVLNSYMNICYSSSDSPLLPNPIPDNTICAAQSEGEWYRAMVLSTDKETNTSHVMFLDYGGYAYLECSKLRQIRGDFLLLPFQAAECVLANVKPAGGEDRWCEDAYVMVADLTRGALTYTQVAEYTNDGVPLVLMYILISPQEVIFLNEELVNRGYADWMPLPQDDSEGAVGGVLVS